MAKEIGLEISFRNARDLVELDEIASELDEIFESMSGYRIETNKPFTFRVWTENEFNKIVKKNDYLVL